MTHSPASSTPSRLARECSRARALTSWCALLASLGLASAAPGDEQVAQALLQSGKAAFEKKAYTEALSLLESARAEHQALREVGYWLGATHDKLGRPQDAVRAWREFRDELAAAAESAPKLEAELLKKAQARLLVLAPGEAEADKLRNAFAADLLAYAKAREVKEPLAAWQALDLLLRAEPGHAEAASRAGRLRSPPRPDESEVPQPLAGLSGWTDLISTRWLGEAPAWIHGDRLLTLDIHDQSVPGPPLRYIVGERCGLDMELRVLSVGVPNWGVGFALFEPNDAQLVGVQVGAKQAAGFRGPPTGPLSRLAETSIPTIDLKTWHRLSVLVQAPKVVVFLDGKKVTQFATDSLVPGTHLRLFVNRCKVELRTLRWALLP